MLLSNARQIIAIVVLATLIDYSSQQYWKNEKIVKQWQPSVSNVAPESESNVATGNGLGTLIGSYTGYGNAESSSQPQQQQQGQKEKNEYVPSAASSYEHVPPAYNSHEYKPPSYSAPSYSAPEYKPEYKPAPAYSAPEYKPEYKPAPSYSAPEYKPPYESHEYNAPSYNSHEPYPSQPVYPLPAGAYPIQQPTITNTGETIIENLVGGISFDCHGKPTGHHRDYKYCDIFHACVYGMQRKTYACPYVGERTYFDEVTKRCEFVYKNPSGCGHNTYYH